MRNLKRALSLAVSTVMLMGMMVVGSGAASYTDVTSEHNTEAIEVLQAVGVMVGDEDGDFNPDQNVTRGEMAVIMSNLLDLGIANYVGAPIPFTDVPDWAHAYVAACYANGITGGTSDTTYGTDDPITAVQAGLMMLKALGYFQYQGDFDNNGGWILGTVSQAARIDLYDGIDAETEQPLTRNDIAQLALNTLEADMVEFTGDRGMDVTSSDGTTVNVGFVSRYDERTSTNDKYGKIDNETADPNVSRYTMQLGEDLYNGDLAKQNTTDDFSRPATEWRFKNDSIGTYADTPDATYTARVNADDIYSAVGKSTADDLLDGTYTLYSYVDNYGGKVALADVASYVDRNNTTKVNESGNGMLTEVYVDHDDETVTIVSINTWVFQASADYSTTRESVNVVSAGDTQITLTSNTLEQDDFDVQDVLADDYLLITATRESNGRYEVKSVTPAEVVTGVVDGYKVNDSVTIDGNPYSYSLNTTKSGDKNETDDPVKSTQYTVGQQAAVVLDAYGYIIAVDEAVVANNYVYISEFAQPDGLSSGKVQASAFFTDGTTETITVKELLGSSSKGDMVPGGDKTKNAGWYTYSANSSNEYSLYKVEDKYIPNGGDWNLNGTFTFTDDSTDNDDVTYNDKVAFLAQSNGQINHNTLKANNSTVVIVNNKEDDDVTAYVGVKNIPDIILRDGGEAEMTVVANASTNYAYYVYIETTGNVSISGSEDTALIYFVEYDGQHRGTDNEIYYTYTTLDGTAEASVEADALLNSIEGNIYAAYYKTRTNSDGQLTDMTAVPATGDGRFFAGYDKSGKISYSDGALTIDGEGYTLADSYTITLVTVGEDLDGDKVTASGLNKDKDAEYEVAIVTAQSLADTLEDCTGLVYDYQGKTTESDGTIIEELYVTVKEATVATGGGEDDDNQGGASEDAVIDSNIEIRDVTTGYTITESHVVTTAEAGDSESKYNGKTPGALYIEFTAPDNVAVDTNAAPTVELTFGGLTYTITMGNNTAIAGTDKYSSISNSGLNPTIRGTAYLDFEAADASGYSVDYVTSAVSGSGYGVAADTSKTDISKAPASGTMKFTITGIPSWMTKVDVSYDITTPAGTTEAVVQSVTVSTGEAQVTTDAFATTGPVTITIKEIKAAEQNITFEGSGASGTGTATTGTKFLIPTFTVDAPANATEVTVSYTISGATSDGTDGFGLTRTATATATAGSASVDADDAAHYTTTGDQVKVTVNSVTVTKVDETKITTYTAAGTVDSGDVTITISSGDITVENGANTAEITLSVDPANNWADAKNVVVKVINGANEATFTSATACTTDSNAVTVTIPVGGLTGITATGNITFEVSLAD